VLIRNCRRLHAEKFGSVKHLPGLAIKRHVNGHKVRFDEAAHSGRDTPREAPFRCPRQLSSGCGTALSSQNLRRVWLPLAQCVRILRSQSFAPNIGSAKLVKVPAFPIAPAHVLVGLHHPAADRQHQRPGKVRGRLVEHAWSIGDHDAAFVQAGRSMLSKPTATLATIRNFGAARNTSSPIFSVSRHTSASLSFSRPQQFLARRPFGLAPEFAFATSLQKLLGFRIQRMGYKTLAFGIFVLREGESVNYHSRGRIGLQTLHARRKTHYSCRVEMDSLKCR